MHWRPAKPNAMPSMPLPLSFSDEESRLGITHAGFAMTSLPHKRIEERFWRREGHRTTLLVESGRNRRGDLVGVPYGSIARLILLYLQTEATRTNCPDVELGRSMNSWMGRMSLSTGGSTYQLVTEQARRISACRLTFFTDRDNGAETRHNGAFVQDAISLAGVIADEPAALWQDRVRLDAASGGRFAITRAGARGSHQGYRHPQPGHRRLYLAGLPAAFAEQVHTGKLDRDARPVRRRLPAGAADQADLPGGAQPGARGLSGGARRRGQGRALLHPSPPAVPKAELGGSASAEAWDSTDGGRVDSTDGRLRHTELTTSVPSRDAAASP